jgi:hypothetical protein
MLASGAEDGKVRQWELTSIPVCCDRDIAKDFNTLHVVGNHTPIGIWSNGTTMWVTDAFVRKIYAYDMTSRARNPDKGFYTLRAAGNTSPGGIWSNGTTMWVTDTFDDKIYAYDMTSRARDPDKDFNTLRAAGNTSSGGIWSNGTTMWVTDIYDDKIYAYDMTSTGSATETPVAQAPADFNSDGTVGLPDFLLFVEQFGLSQGNAGYDARYDLDGDGIIGIGDFLIFVDAFEK